MVTLKDAAQQALSCLEKFVQNELTVGQRYTNEGQEMLRSIFALRAALAEQQAEPVAYMYFDSDGDAIFGHPNGYRPDDAVPVYTAPQPAKREPLTDEQIAEIVDRHTTDDHGYDIWCDGKGVARAIERAHGIGEQE